MNRRTLLAAALLLPLAACLRSPDRPDLASPEPHFDAAAFFAGSSHGNATLKVVFKAPVPVHVASHGRIARDGTLILDQTIREGARPPRTRQWHIRETAPGRYAGTLSDAAGPVTGTVAGNLLTLDFAMKGGLAARQWLYLQPGGRVAINRMTVSKWGIRIATLEETITKD